MEENKGNAHWLLSGSSGLMGLAGSAGVASSKALYILGLIVLAQLTSGICVVILEKSQTRTQKIVKLCISKVMIAFIVSFAFLLNHTLPGDYSLFSNLIIWFYVAEEGLSFLQNMSKLGVPFPAKLQQFFKKQKEEMKKEEKTVSAGEAKVAIKEEIKNEILNELLQEPSISSVQTTDPS